MRSYLWLCQDRDNLASIKKSGIKRERHGNRAQSAQSPPNREGGGSLANSIPVAQTFCSIARRADLDRDQPIALV